MCGGPPKLEIGDTVRLYGGETLGEIVEIDRSARRRYLYTVRWDSGAATLSVALPRRDLVKTSRRNWAIDARDPGHIRRIEVELRIKQRREARQRQKETEG